MWLATYMSYMASRDHRPSTLNLKARVITYYNKPPFVGAAQPFWFGSAWSMNINRINKYQSDRRSRAENDFGIKISNGIGVGADHTSDREWFWNMDFQRNRLLLKCVAKGPGRAGPHIWARCPRQLQDRYKTTTRQVTSKATRQFHLLSNCAPQMCGWRVLNYAYGSTVWFNPKWW